MDLIEGMSFPFVLMAGSFLAGLAVSSVATPAMIGLCRRIGLLDSPGERKIHHTPVPLAGGPAILLTLVLVISWGVVFLYLSGGMLSDEVREKLRYGWSVRGLSTGLVLAGAFILTVMGVLDDRQALRAGPKFLVQLAAAIMVSLAGIRITIFIDNVIAHHLLTIFWIMVLVNAFNFIDNMNGASAGLAVIAMAACSVVGAQAGQYLVPTFGFLTVGAVLGFLPYNFPKGRSFLGDSGSHLLGYLVAVVTILATYYSDDVSGSRYAVLLPVMFVIVPLVDITQVTLYRMIRRRPVWIGDTNHLTHRLSRSPLGKVGAVVCLWIVAILCAVIPAMVFRRM